MDYIDLSRRFRDLTESELETPELLASLNDLPVMLEPLTSDQLEKFRDALAERLRRSAAGDVFGEPPEGA